MNPALHLALFLAAIGAAILGVMMLLLWRLQQRLRNAGYVDIGWAYGLGILGILYAWLGQGNAVRRWALAAMVLVWSLRLGTHLLKRIAGHPEEGRYVELRKKWRKSASWKFLIFFEAQAVLDVLLSLPLLLVCVDASDTALGPWQWSGIALWLIAVAGESLADAQLAAFKRRARPGEVCRNGLWNYSRHPNYFFEWLVWMGWAIFAITSPWGWLGFASPALMLLFLFRVTGIPATEAQSLRSKGDAYRAYQRTTSAFFPWPHRQKGKS
jgi:steroid 5-alpha reductase family enzyme